MLYTNQFSIFFPRLVPFPKQSYYTYAYRTETAALPLRSTTRLTATPLNVASMPARRPVQFYML